MSVNIVNDNKITNFYGRTTGHLGKKAKILLEDLLPCYSIDLEGIRNENFKQLTTKYKTVNLEIGFGSGDFIFNSCLKNPENLYLGAEVFLNGVSSLLDKVYKNNLEKISSDLKCLPNLYIYNGNIYDVFDYFIEDTFDNIYILFPDPWPKKKHHKRRLINQENLSIFSKILKPNANLRFVSDHYNYVEWALENIIKSINFSWKPKTIKDFSKPPVDHFETKYERKAILEGRKITYIDCINNK